MVTTVGAAAASAILLGAAAFLLLAPGSAASGNLLRPGETLLHGKSLTIGNKSLTMQEDCNLVLHQEQTQLWETNTAGMGTDCFLYLQVNGELILWSKKAYHPVWRSGTSGGGLGNFVLVLQPDGNAVLFSSAVWSTNKLDATNNSANSKQSTP